jgi:hypothetical protein
MPFSSGFLSGLFPSDPVTWVQATVIAVAFLLVYLLLFTLRDILLRTRSFWYQFFCVLLVGCLPVFGFLLYLLIRPARTVKERELESMLHTLGILPDDEELFDADLEAETEEELQALAEDDSTTTTHTV